MKRIVSFILCAAMLVTALTLVSCGGDNTVKFGAGSYATASATSATAANEETGAAAKNGTGTLEVTAAAVLVKNGKIVKCVLDCMSSAVNHNANGEAIKTASFKTKKELGDNYNMVAYGHAIAEWYAQAAAFEALVVGKTVDQIKALVVEGGKGTQDVINAGCTITVIEFVNAIEKAVASAKTTTATDIKLSMVTSQTATNYTPENEETGAAAKDGCNEVNTTIFAAAVDAEGKIVDCTYDCAQAKFTFDQNGASKFGAEKVISTKRELGDSYGMVAYGNAVAEWYAQADAFAAKCVGKTGLEVASLMGSDYKGVADVQSAGCTIYVSDFVAAAAKIA